MDNNCQKMFCRMCLHKNIKIYYKLNNKYVDLIECITKVKMELDDLVCCFCLTTLRKIEKFTKMVKEVDFILKQSIKTEEDVHEVNKYYNLEVSTDTNISIECLTGLYETYVCNIRDALLRQVERDLVKIEETQDEPLHLSEDTIINIGTHSTSNVPSLTVTVNKEEKNESTAQNDEPHQLPEDTIVDNETDSEDDVPLISIPHIKSESEKPLNDTCDDDTTEIKDEPHQLSEDTIVDDQTDSEDDVPLITLSHIKSETEKLNDTCDDDTTETNEAALNERLNRTSRQEVNNKVITELPREKEVKQNITRKRRNKININDVLSNEISKQNDVDTICSGDKPFSCDTCGYRAKCKSYLTRHLRNHTGEKPFACNICPYKFSWKSSLRDHFRTHTGEKPFSCNICSYKCSKKSDLKVHLRRHTGEKPFSCNICSYKCNQRTDLKVHLRRHTGEKPFACNICSYKSCWKTKLRYHLRTHTGEKPFSCNICSYKCSQKSDLIVHFRRHTGEKPFSCNICSYKCSMKSNLTKHSKSHSGERSFSCDLCAQKTKSKSELKTHLVATCRKPISAKCLTPSRVIII